MEFDENDDNNNNNNIQIKLEKEDASTSELPYDFNPFAKKSSKVGSTELRKLTRNLHVKKRLAIKNFRIDSTKERNKQEFLNKLKGVICGQKIKINGIHSELREFQKSIYELSSSSSSEEVPVKSSLPPALQSSSFIESKNSNGKFEEDEDDFYDDILITPKSTNQKRLITTLNVEIPHIIDSEISKSKNANDIISDERISQILDLQIELDKRQRILANIHELTLAYLDKKTKESEKNQLFLNEASRKVVDVTHDVLRYVNHLIIDHQVVDKMYISSRTTRQDIYEVNPTISKTKEENKSHIIMNNQIPLFKNYRIDGHITNSSEKGQVLTELKKIIAIRSKKRAYSIKN